MDNSVPGTGRRVLVISLTVSIAVLLVGVMLLGWSAYAATYTANLNSAVNWTSTTTSGPAVWQCVASTAAGDTCGQYPGQLALPAGITDLANITNSGGTATMTVNSTIPHAVTLNENGPVGVTLDVTTGGQLSLAGSSTVTGASAQNVLSISGGTVSNTGTLQFSGASASGPTGELVLNTGTLSGSGTTIIQGTGVLQVTATSPMTVNNQAITNQGVANFTSPGTLTVNSATLANTGTFNMYSGATMNGTSNSAFQNNGAFNNFNSAATISIPFVNGSGNVNVLSGTLSLNGGTGVGNDSGNWTVGPNGPTSPIGTLNLGGVHSFTGGTFSGNSSLGLQNVINVQPGGGFTVGAPTITMAPGIDFNNNGTLAFTLAGDTLNIGGNYTQASTAQLQEQVASPNTSSLLAVTGAANLAGSFSAAGTPAVGEKYTVLTFGSRAGDFASYSLPNPPGGVMTHSYPGNFLQLAAVAAVDLQVSKNGPLTVAHNQNVTYNINVKNLSAVTTATNVVITDSFTSGTFVSGTGCASAGPSSATCTVASIAPGATAAFTVTLNANSLGSLNNTASLTSLSEVDTNSANNQSTAVTNVTPAADLGLTKSGTPSTVLAGGAVTYTLQIGNNGPDAANNVTMTDTLPAGMTSIAATGTGWTCSVSGTTVTCTMPSLAPPPSPTSPLVFSQITITANAPTAAGTITNTATVTATEADPNPSNNTGTAVTAVNGAADLSITKTGPATATAGSNISYSITVINNGPSNVSNAQVTDTPGTNLTFVSNSGICAGGFPCTIPTLNAGSSVTFTSVWQVNPNATGNVTNTATVTAPASVTETVPGNNSQTATTTVTQSNDVSITKTGPATASPGQSITYTLTVANAGPSTATNIIVNDPAPAQTTLSSVSGSLCTAFPCTIPSLLPGTSTTVTATYVVSSTATGVINNVATATTANDPNNTNNTATLTTSIAPTADLAITKTAPPTVFGGAQTAFVIQVTNNGPSSATNIVVSDTPSAGLTFVSNSGACTTPFPCTIASLASGGSATITSTYQVSSNVSSISNTASVSTTSAADPNSANNSSTVARNVGTNCPAVSVIQSTPAAGQTDAPISGNITWNPVSGASQYQVYMGPAGSGCSTLVGTVKGTSFAYSGLTPATDYESRIVATRPGCSTVGSQCVRWRTAAPACNLGSPTLIAPVAGTISSPTTLRWSSVAGADSYHVVVTVNGSVVIDQTTPNTTLDVTIPNGSASWTVTAISGNCSSAPATAQFGVCNTPPAPLAGVVGAPTSGNTYQVIVVNAGDLNASSYEFQEADNDSFNNAQTQTSNSPVFSYTKSTDHAIVFFYRVRAIGGCANTAGPYSKTVRVVILPPQNNVKNPSVNVPAGSNKLQVIQVQIPGDGVNENFTASSDRPWIVKIEPNAGILPPNGITLNVTIDPAQLPNGTFTSTVIVSTSSLTNSGRIQTEGSNSKQVPVTINLVTPVVPVNPSGPTSDSLIIPVVGHAAGLNSQWRSDIRVYNASPQTLQYVLNFTPQGTTTDVKQTTITTPSGATTALDDIIHNWFGVGEVGDSSTGMLEIRPMTTDGNTTPPKGGSFLTIASSRTYNATTDGTVGQFIPPVKFTNFITTGARLSMQQLAQSNSYRTNFGLLEASGSPVNLVLSMFNSAGSKLFDLPVSLAGGEQKMLNGLLASQGLTINDGRMEVNVVGGSGKVTAYASVIDNASEDPQLVPGQNLGTSSSKLYVVPGLADLSNGAANWRSDMRIYNSGNAPQTATLTFFAQDNASAPQVATVTINPNEVTVLDNVVQSLFGKSNLGGAVQLTTPGDSQLVVTARTYDQTANGTLGQFIKAATTDDAVTANGKALNILQVEDSPRFRTNLGVAEMSGKPVTVEVSIVLPDSKITPSIQVPLSANEFRQFSVAQFGLGNIYNARVSVKVVDGQGSVTAYGSVIDQITTDPTYVQAQQ